MHQPCFWFTKWDWYMFGKLSSTPMHLLLVFDISTFINKTRITLQTRKWSLWLQLVCLYKFLEFNQRNSWLSFTIFYTDKTLPNENNQSRIKYNQANSNSLQLVHVCAGNLFRIFKNSTLLKHWQHKYLHSIYTHLT